MSPNKSFPVPPSPPPFNTNTDSNLNKQKINQKEHEKSKNKHENVELNQHGENERHDLIKQLNQYRHQNLAHNQEEGDDYEIISQDSLSSSALQNLLLTFQLQDRYVFKYIQCTCLIFVYECIFTNI
jgi:hypothetical protein